MNRLASLALLMAACHCDLPTDTDDGTDIDTDSDSDSDSELGTVSCTPPAREVLADIPDVARLGDVANNVQVVFEVDGDDLIGKFVRDATVAEGALTLWQEIVLRIPLNQRTQLVQFTLFESSSLAGYVNNVGTGNQTGRYGPALFLNSSNIQDNDPDVCAPLSGHRGTFDWTMIHEFGHMRQYADGHVNDFVERFNTPTGDGEGYPDDGSPSLDGDFVTSYAERAGGDEDAAESFTTYIMLDTLPDQRSAAADKVHFFDQLTDYPALRQAIRVTEPGGGGTVPAAPLLNYGLDIQIPVWLHGNWQGDGPDGLIEYTFVADDVTIRQTFTDGVDEVNYSTIRDDGTLAVITTMESNESFLFLQVAIGNGGYSESFFLQSDGSVDVEHEDIGLFSIHRVTR